MTTPTDAAARAAAVLNELYPPGTPVAFWPGPVGLWESGLGPRLRRTRGEWFVAASGTLAVFLAGESGYVAASHVCPLHDITRTAHV